MCFIRLWAAGHICHVSLSVLPSSVSHPQHGPLFWFKPLLNTNPVSTPVLECWVTFLCCLFAFYVTPSGPWAWGGGTSHSSHLTSLPLACYPKGFSLKVKKNFTSPHLLNYALLTSGAFSSLYLDMVASHARAHFLDGEEIHRLTGSSGVACRMCQGDRPEAPFERTDLK